MTAERLGSLASDRDHRLGLAAVVVAAIVWSTTGLVQRQLTVDLATQLAGRAIIAALALAAFLAVTRRGDLRAVWWSIGRSELVVSVCLAANAGCFIAALNYGTVARTTFISILGPMLAAALAWLVFRDPIDRIAGAALVVALMGAMLMVATPGAAQPLGDAFAGVAAIAWAVALVVARRHRSASMLPATCLAQVLVAVGALPFADPTQVTTSDAAYLTLGGLQVAIALGLVTVGAQRIPAVQTATLSILEAPLAPVWVWLALNERPDAATLLGGAVITGAAALQARRGSAPRVAVPPGGPD